MSGRRRPKSRGEETLVRHLTWAGYPFQREYRFAPGRQWRADFRLPGRLLIEIEGISYRGEGTRHQRGQSFEKDAEKYNGMMLEGYALLRFTARMIAGSRKGRSHRIVHFEPALSVIDRYYFTDLELEEMDRSVAGYGGRAIRRKSWRIVDFEDFDPDGSKFNPNTDSW